MNELFFKTKSWWKGEWQMLESERVLAEISIKKWNWSVFEVIIGSERFEIGYSGWWGQKLFLRDANGTTLFEVQPEKWWKNEIEIFLNGRRYMLKDNWWKNRFAAQSDGGVEVMTLTPDWWRGSARVQTTLPIHEQSTLLLAAIMLYRLKVAEMSYGSAAASSVVVVSS